jgi:hypothetical protein
MEYATVSSAVYAAEDGDEVILHLGRHGGPKQNSIPINGKAITVRSVDPDNPEIVDSTIYEGWISFSGEAASGSVLEGLTIGGSVRLHESNPIIRNCHFNAEDSHCIYSQGGSPQIYNCSFVGAARYCRGYGVAIQIYNNRNLALPARIDHCLISVKSPADNYYYPFGPAVGIADGAVEITNTTFAYNDMYYALSNTPPGSALLIERSDATLNNSIVYDNPAKGNMEIAVVNHSSDPADPLNSHLDISYSLYYWGQEKILLCPTLDAYDLYRDSGILPDPNHIVPETLVWGAGNIDHVNPLFVRQPYSGGDGWFEIYDQETGWDYSPLYNNDYGDYHLKSAAGRFVWDGFARADFNLDQRVDLGDFSMLAQYWNRSVYSYPEARHIDMDGGNMVINEVELAAFLDDYLAVRVFGAWVVDDVTSPCIDAGDPNDGRWRDELWPRGACEHGGLWRHGGGEHVAECGGSCGGLKP